jgi:outer membrane receptor for ferrienterochelin and colicin
VFDNKNQKSLEKGGHKMNSSSPMSVYYRPSRIYPLIWIFVILFFTFISAISWANQGTEDLTELSIEDLMKVKIETVSKFEQRMVDAPASVSIITNEEIKKYGYRNLADLLKGVRGLFVTYDRAYNYLGMRGFNRPGDYNMRFLLLIDGHRVNDSIYDTAAVGNDLPLDIDLVDRVEIIRGPGSTLYGANAVRNYQYPDSERERVKRA